VHAPTMVPSAVADHTEVAGVICYIVFEGPISGQHHLGNDEEPGTQFTCFTGTKVQILTRKAW
jgi:hypothetical protein